MLGEVCTSLKSIELHVYCIEGALWDGYLKNVNMGFGALDTTLINLATQHNPCACTKLVMHVRLESDLQLRLVRDWMEGFLTISIEGGMLLVEWTSVVDCDLYEEYV